MFAFLLLVIRKYAFLIRKNVFLLSALDHFSCSVRKHNVAVQM